MRQDLFNFIMETGCDLSKIRKMDFYKDGDHTLSYTKNEWDFVVKVLKEDTPDCQVYQRHQAALETLGGLVADFRFLPETGKDVMIIQEKVKSFLHEDVIEQTEMGRLDEAKKLILEYIDLNIQLWSRGRFDWHFRIDHCGFDRRGRLVFFDIGGIRGLPTLHERLKWRSGYFRRKHKKNQEILAAIHPDLVMHYKKSGRKTLTRKKASDCMRNPDPGEKVGSPKIIFAFNGQIA